MRSSVSTTQQVLDYYFNKNLGKKEKRVKYIKPHYSCLRKRNFFDSDDSPCNTPHCNAPSFCHLTIFPYSGCDLTLENQTDNLTKEGLCKICLSKKICCILDSHLNIEKSTNNRYRVSSKNFIFKIINQLVYYEFHNNKEDNSLKRIWKIDNHYVKWLGLNKQIFLNRKIYDDFINIIFDPMNTNDSMFLVLGTSGIGKSSFINRVFYEIIQNWKSSLSSISIYYQFRHHGKDSIQGYVIYFIHNFFQVYSVNEIPDDITHHISDGVDISFTKASIITLLIGTDNPKDYTNFLNRMADTTSTKSKLFMPPFEEEELYAISPNEWSGKIKKFRYSITGGNPRTYFYKCDNNPYILTQVAKSLIKYSDIDFSCINLDDEQEIFIPSIDQLDPRSITYHFYSMANLLSFGYSELTSPNFFDINNGITIHQNKFYNFQWASTIIKLLAGDLNKKNKNDLDTLLLLNKFNIEECKFESYIHYIIFNNRPTLELINMIDYGNNIKLNLQNILNESPDNKYYLTLNNNIIQRLPLKKYGIISSYFNINSIIQPNIIIKIITNHNYTININELNNIRNYLNDSYDKHILIYIVDKDLPLSFNINDLNIIQCITSIDHINNVKNSLKLLRKKRKNCERN